MRRFCFIGSAIISIFYCCTFLPAQENVNYQEFVEAEIVLTDTLTIADIEALPKAPGSNIETLNDGSTVRVQIPAAAAQELADNGVQITIIRSFLLVQNANTVAALSSMEAIASSSYEYGDEGTDVYLSPSEWRYSYINYSGFPYSYTVTGVDVHYQVVVNGIVDIKLANANGSLFYDLEEAISWPVNETVIGISTFNGQPLAQAWALCGYDYYGYNSYIDYWWIKLYYESGSSYCTASGGCDEYIYDVVVGSINNISACDGYADYTSQSTTMDIGTSYPIEVITAVNGNPYAGYEGDRCGIWIDWNQDGDFDDTGEMVFSEINYGYFTTNITPPAGAVTGDTRMRIRLAYDIALSPCGAAGYGEVEDYTINVADSAPPSLKVSGYVTHRWDDSPVSGVLLEIYNGSGAGVPTGLTDISDATGYYEIEVPSPWTGHVKATKTHYAFGWVTNFNNVTTDQIQDFSAYYTYSGGFGSSGSPYLIATAEDMNAIGSHSEDWNCYFNVVSDINLAEYNDTRRYRMAGNSSLPFNGSFDGQNYLISNLTYLANDRNQLGLFGLVGTAGEIFNVRMENVNIHISTSGGMMSGMVGAIAGQNQGIIFQCSSSGRLAGSYSIGGLIGANNGVISQCFSAATVKGEMNIGGLVGYNSSHVNNSYARGDVSGNMSGSGDMVGGFVGSNSGPISDCYQTGFASGSYSVGRFVGYNTGQLHNCFDRLTVTKTISTYLNAGWDFTGETDHGTDNIWRMCGDGEYYPRLSWEFLSSDFLCPDGVDFIDYAILAKQWMLEKLSYDVSPTGGDGIVDFSDFAVFANNWQGDMIQLSEFISQWLQPGVYNADITPLPNGDGVVDEFDFALFAENWLEE